MKMSGRASQKEHCFLGTPYGGYFLSILLFFLSLKSSEVLRLFEVLQF